MSYYPPGVTGNEYEIAGADFERDETRDVDQCANGECGPFWEGPVTVEGMTSGYRREFWFNWTCPACGHDNQEDLPDEEPEPEEPDYDRDYEPDDWP